MISAGTRLEHSGRMGQEAGHPVSSGVPVVMVMVAGPYLSPVYAVVMRVLDIQTLLTSPFQVLTGGLTEPMSVK